MGLAGPAVVNAMTAGADPRGLVPRILDYMFECMEQEQVCYVPCTSWYSAVCQLVTECESARLDTAHDWDPVMIGHSFRQAYQGRSPQRWASSCL